jgi:hypothetical protein
MLRSCLRAGASAAPLRALHASASQQLQVLLKQARTLRVAAVSSCVLAARAATHTNVR